MEACAQARCLSISVNRHVAVLSAARLHGRTAGSVRVVPLVITRYLSCSVTWVSDTWNNLMDPLLASKVCLNYTTPSKLPECYVFIVHVIFWNDELNCNFVKFWAEPSHLYKNGRDPIVIFSFLCSLLLFGWTQTFNTVSNPKVDAVCRQLVWSCPSLSI